MSPKIHSARNVRVHSFMRVCVVGAGTPGILPEDQDSMLDKADTKKALQSPAEEIKAQRIEQSKVGQFAFLSAPTSS